ncbi:MAG: RluA family pseudouridine synthase [Spirochaetes bacterium]|nr:RluA family pseudouridine synthase [Spirochaetota bacterium]
MKIYRNIPIIYEDNHIIVVEKPYGLLCQKDYTNSESLLEIIKEYIKITYNKPGNVFLGLVHRLDKQVAGLIVYAKTSKAASRVSAQFRSHDVIKLYCAAVKTPTSTDNNWHTVYDRLIRVHDKTLVNNNENSGMHASLKYKRIHTQQEYSLVLIQLYTGKKHQIRSQLSNLKMPILNDTKYGGERITNESAIALHAIYLQFSHPVTKETMTFYSSPQKIFLSVFKKVDIDSVIKEALIHEGYLV